VSLPTAVSITTVDLGSPAAYTVGMTRPSRAYAALMTDSYPPFRLDQGGPDPAPPPTSSHSGSSPATVAAASD
jgi:hypothetical protein